METTKMKIEYRKQIDSETAPWQLLTNIDELLWNGVYALRVTDDDGSHHLPFRFGNDDTVTLVIKDHAHEGMLENGRTIVQTITRVDRTTGNVFVYTRTRYNVDGTPCWNYWALATEGEAVIDMPKATQASLGAVIVGNGLAVDADGKISVAPASIAEDNLQPALKDKITEAASKAKVTDFFVKNDGLALHYGALLQNDVPYVGTALRVHTDKILSAGEQLVVNEGYVISTLKIFDGEQEIAYADYLSETRYTLDAKGMHYQFEFSKLNMTPFTDDELSQVVKAYHRRPIVWSSAHHIDHFVAAGTYCITGERTNIADGLPITNAASGHSINARLVVLDSSIPGSGKESDKCITQVLALSNRVGADSNIYVRTGRAADTARLIAGNGWGAWGKLQQNIEVGQTTSLDGYVDNGIYSGLFTNGTTFFETFVMVVINNYAVATVAGTARSITQVKYGVGIDGAFSYKVRTGQGTDSLEWGEWSDLDTVTTDRVQDGAVTADKLSADVREKVENPLRPLYIAAGAEYNDSGADKTKTAPWGETVTHKAGHYYLNGLGDITEEQMMDIYNYRDVIFNVDCSRIAQNISTRTFFSAYIKSGTITQLLERRKLQGYSSFHSCINLEILWFTKSPKGLESTSLDLLPATNILDGTFADCISLRIISGINCSGVTSFNNTFIGCSSLVEVRLYRISANVSFESSANISKNSIIYMVKNASPTSAITITLHPDAYARLADDAEVVAALEAQPLISLVSA